MSIYTYLDSDAYYVYPNTSVLRNKHDIIDAQKLEEAEHLLVSIRLAELYDEPIKVESMDDVCKIHQYIFQDIYEWAGAFRVVNISKSDKPFIPLQSFAQSTIYIDSLIHKVIVTNSKNDLIDVLADLLDNLNYMHPFREGNGRTQREAIRSLLFYKGLIVEVSSPDDEELYDFYMEGTINSDVTLLRQLFNKIMR